MKREEQAKQACTNWVCNEHKDGDELRILDAYISAVAWADAHPNWISVEDELPKTIDKTIEGKEFTATCFVCNRYNEYYAAYYVHCNDEWCGWYDEDGNEIVDVTHWMEIVPPEKGGAK